MGSVYEILRIKNGRTIMAIDTSKISKIKNLEKDLLNLDLFDESKRGIEREIGRETLDLLAGGLGDYCLGNSCKPECAHYKGSEGGIDVPFQNYEFLDKGEGPYNPGAKPNLNIQINKDESLSLQLDFYVRASFLVLKDLMQLHSTLTGRYTLSENSAKGPVVNPVNEGAFFLEAAKKLYQKLEGSGTIHDTLRDLRRELNNSPIEDVNQTYKGLYAIGILDILGVDLD